MDPVSAALITGGSSLLSGFMSSTTSAANVQAQIASQQQMQGQSEQFNAQQAQIARDYTTQMSNSAYQRASADMQKAGLNPAMMFGSGGAASTPGSPAASIGTPTPPVGAKSNPLAGLGDAVGKAVNSAIEAKTFDRMTEEIANLKTQRGLTAAQTLTEEKRPGLTSAQTARTEADTQSAREDIAIKGPAAVEAEGVLDLPDSVVRGAGKVKYGAGAVNDVITPIVNSALRVKGLNLLRDAFDAREAMQGIRH